MNCKPGDLAIIVRSGFGNNGKIVKIICGLGIDPTFAGRWWAKKSGPTFYWLVESQGSPLISNKGYCAMSGPVADAALRPIRGDDDTTNINEHLEQQA